MSDKRILLLGQYRYRDLSGLVLVKNELELLGQHNVTIVPFIRHRVNYYLRKFKPNIVTFPEFFSAYHHTLAKQLKKLGIHTAIIYNEGTSFYEKMEDNSFIGKNINHENIDLLFAWNKRIANLIKQNKNLTKTKINTISSPRFDFYQPKFQDFLMSREEFCQLYNVDPKSKIVTLTTNFGYAEYHGNADMIKLLLEYNEREWVDLGSQKDVEKTVEIEANVRNKITEFAINLADNRPDIFLIIKVHPAENKNWYLNKTTNKKNIRVISDEIIWNVLNATDLHLHRTCTTPLEAWLLNKPTVNIQLPEDYYVEDKMKLGELTAHSLDQFMNHINFYLSDGKITKKQLSARKKIIEYYLGKIDGKNAKRYAKTIHEFLEKTDNNPKIPQLTIHDTYFNMNVFIKSLLGLKPNNSLRDFFKEKKYHKPPSYFDSNDVEFIQKKIKSIMGREKLNETPSNIS